MMRLEPIRILFGLLLLAPCQPAFGKIRLPRLISDGMVLQANAPVRVWGWASASEAIAVHFLDAHYSTTADDSGRWEIMLPARSPGGPFDMTLCGGDTVRLQNILVGEVWICSGQSNMELSMARVRPLYEADIAAADNAFIRYIEIPKEYDFQSRRVDISGGQWQSINQESILKCSAVAYFFARELYARYRVPIGLINASLGGSPVEAWMAESALKAFPEYFNEAQRFKDSSLIQQIESSDKTRADRWYRELRALDLGYKDPDNPWFAPNLNTADWARMNVPGYWKDGPLGNMNGVVWFRKEFDVPVAAARQPAKLNLGRIVDADSVFINGVFVGSTGYQYPPRWYAIPPDLLKAGKNVITVRVINSSGSGGFVPDKPYEMVVAGHTVDLTGEWKVRLGAKMDALDGPTFIRWKPAGLFNGMIAPLLKYRIKGVIWYQGESNTKQPNNYTALFTTMISNWRTEWQQGDFPFLYVQLANFMEPRSQPSESNWAALREAQRKTLTLPQTGMAITIDLGEWNDIHPLHKREVGLRLALAAQKVAYGADDLTYSGPIYQFMEIRRDTVVLSFTHTESGLVSNDGEALRQFSIAGPDHHFVWAQAKIERNQVFVWSDQVPQPVVVRYAWADNPVGANLYNKAGLPASPFSTD